MANTKQGAPDVALGIAALFAFGLGVVAGRRSKRSAAANTQKLVCLTYLIRRKDNMTPEEFHSYWTQTHGALFLDLPVVKQHLVKYVQLHKDEEVSKEISRRLGMTASDFDGAACLYARSIDDLEAIFADPQFQAVIGPDGKKFVVEGDMVGLAGQELVWDLQP